MPLSSCPVPAPPAPRALPSPRRLVALGAVTVLLATGYSNVAQAAMDDGFTILRKPYNSAELKASIDKGLGLVALKAIA